jgi:hypothetical protein
MTGLTVLPAVELLSMLRRGQISPLELTDEYIQQIERLNPQLNALVDFDAEGARAQARALEGSSGPLFGLPMTIKSSIATAGYRCESGSLLHRGNRPRENATAVDRLTRAGAVILGAQPIRGIWNALRADRAEGNRLRWLPGFPPRDWAATAADRYASRPTIPAYVRLSPHLAVFRVAVTCLLATDPLRSLALSDPWRVRFET